MAHVMVLDDEPSICWAFRNFLGDDGHRVTVASSAEAGFEQLATDPPDVLFLDVRLPGMDGLAALDRIRERAPELPVVVMTAFGTMQTAVRAVRGGALDYLPKPFDLQQARELVSRALERSRSASIPTKTAETPGEMIGRGPAMQAVFKQIALAAASAAPVLITGESGTGKELVARAIHNNGDRASLPFVPVHLAALPETLAERELFGHERGAFTGADAAKPGLLHRAGRGTIFFDEIAEAPMAIQSKLLRVLDGHEYRPVGGGNDLALDARVISATNRDLRAWTGTGAFRADLYYRLAVVPIHLPPLRDRRDEIPELWDHYVARAAPGQHAPLSITSGLAQKLITHSWPGNVRELRNAAESAARSAQNGPIRPEHLPPLVGSEPQDALSLDPTITRWVQQHLSESDESPLHDALIRAVEAPLFRALWTWSGGNQARMARRLGLHRTTLRQKLRQLGIDANSEEISP